MSETEINEKNKTIDLGPIDIVFFFCLLVENQSYQSNKHNKLNVKCLPK